MQIADMICRECGTHGPPEKFAKHVGSPGGRQRLCKKCDSARSKKWAQENPEKRRDTKLIYEFNISHKEYISMLAKQSNVCAICQQPETVKLRGILKRLAVDHCHATGKIRGLLCQGCNTSLGNFNDDVSLLERAIAYLKSHSGT